MRNRFAAFVAIVVYVTDDFMQDCLVLAPREHKRAKAARCSACKTCSRALRPATVSMTTATERTRAPRMSLFGVSSRSVGVRRVDESNPGGGAACGTGMLHVLLLLLIVMLTSCFRRSVRCVCCRHADMSRPLDPVRTKRSAER